MLTKVLASGRRQIRPSEPSCWNSVPATTIPDALDPAPDFIGHLALPDTAQSPGKQRIPSRLLLNTLDECFSVIPEQVLNWASSQEAEKRFGSRVGDRCEDAFPRMLRVIPNKPVELVEADELVVLFAFVGWVTLPSSPQEPIIDDLTYRLQ